MFQISLSKGQSNIMSFPLTIWCHQNIYTSTKQWRVFTIPMQTESVLITAHFL